VRRKSLGRPKAQRLKLGAPSLHHGCQQWFPRALVVSFCSFGGNSDLVLQFGMFGNWVSMLQSWVNIAFGLVVGCPQPVYV
jgi:hypothetical protein